MFSSAAAFYANATEQLYISSLDESVWDSVVYYPPIETSSGVYYYNYLQEYCYGPAYYGYQYYQVYYPVAYSADYYNLVYYEPAYSGYYMPVYYVPSYLYYVTDMYPGPVDESSVACSSADEFDKFDSDLYDTAMGFSKKSCEILTDGIGEVNTTCYLYYEECPKKLNDDPNDDEENSTSCNSEAICKEESSLEVLDSDYECAILDLCSKFEKLSLHDDEAKSSSSKPNDNSGEDPSRKSDDNSVEDLSSKSDDSRVEDSSCNSDDNSSEDSSSSGSYEVNYTAIKSEGNIMDLHHIDDYTHSRFVTSSSSGDNKFITKENSEVIPEFDEDSCPICIDMIVSSEEYLSIQDNLEHAKLYKDHLYRESLKKNPRREKNILFDVLPTIVEESTPLMDDTPIASEEEINTQDRMIVPHEMISSVEDEPVTSNIKQPKSRLKSFRKWLLRLFCCCCSTKDPP